MGKYVQIVCFCEDYAQQKFIQAIIERITQEEDLECRIEMKQSIGRGSRAWQDVRDYLRDLERYRYDLPDVLVVCIDGDCHEREILDGIEQVADRFGFSRERLVRAVPKSHIECWYLMDLQALSTVIREQKGGEIRLKEIKYDCKRDKCKRILAETFRDAGIDPRLGGAEYGDLIAKRLDYEKMDKSFEKFRKELKGALRRYKQLERERDEEP